ncbi:hypothetical protein BHE74_00009014, partial [Ensete ventricosum]
ICNTNRYRLYRAVHTGLSADSMRTAYYRAVPPIGAVSAPRYQKKREKKRENLESDATLPISIHRLRAISLLTRSVARSLLPAGDFFSPRREKERGNIALVTSLFF